MALGWPGMWGVGMGRERLVLEEVLPVFLVFLRKGLRVLTFYRVC